MNGLVYVVNVIIGYAGSPGQVPYPQSREARVQGLLSQDEGGLLPLHC